MEKYLKSVMLKEVNSLLAMIEGLDYQEAGKVIDLIENREGKLFFMGLGKSGHIAEKLAATFSSLGTPTFYIHALEARHGDFGMIEKGDVVIICSNSGKGQEVLSNVDSVKEIGAIPIAFSGKKDSPLVAKCDAALVYPFTEEADDLNKAPTSSSTMELVLGDAIACYLSHRKNFTKEDFLRYHPNGALGESLSKEVKK